MSETSTASVQPPLHAQQRGRKSTQNRTHQTRDGAVVVPKRGDGTDGTNNPSVRAQPKCNQGVTWVSLGSDAGVKWTCPGVTWVRPACNLGVTRV